MSSELGEKRYMAGLNFRLVTAGVHFLYLPVYYAAYRNFFGLIPEGYSLEIDTQKSRSDRTAYKMLTNRDFEAYSDVAFAVCDPTMLIDVPTARNVNPIVACALVSNIAFWAIDHESPSVRSISDLKHFKKIISFEAGTTGHRIAQHIRRVANDKIQIETVQMGSEILALQSRPSGTLALSPNLLELDEIVSNRAEFSFTFDLASTPEFSNIVITSLITRHDVATEHKELFEALIRSLAVANSMVRSENEEVVRYAADKFNCPVARAKSALRRGNAAQIFPAGLELTSPQWENAARAYYETKGKDFSGESKNLTSILYDAHIRTYVDKVRLITSTPPPPPPPDFKTSNETATNLQTISYLIGLGLAIGGVVAPTLATGYLAVGSIQIAAALAFVCLMDSFYAYCIVHSVRLRAKPAYIRKVSFVLSTVAGLAAGLWSADLIPWQIASPILGLVWTFYGKLIWDVLFKHDRG